MYEQQTRPVAAIKIGKRFRKNMGDIAGLAREIDHLGLLHPIVITTENLLIAGERRLHAWQQSKYAAREIPVHVVDMHRDIARAEFSENIFRKKFTPSEMVALKREVMPYIEFETKERLRVAGRKGGKLAGRSRPNRRAANSRTPIGPTGKRLRLPTAADRVATYAGADRRTIQKAEAVIRAAEAEPEKYGKLVEEMDRTGKVNHTYQQIPRIYKGSVPKSTVKRFYSEPKGNADATLSRSSYHIIVVEELRPELAPRLRSLAAVDCTLWIWLTDIAPNEAFRFADEIGFPIRSIISWVKRTRLNNDAVRIAVDHCLLAVRGNPVINEATGFETKPDKRKDKGFRRPLEFSDFVTRVTPGRDVLQFFGQRPTFAGWDFIESISEKEAA